MKFCDNCGNVLIISSGEEGRFFLCRKCNIKYPLDKEVVFTTEVENQKEVIVFDSEESIFPVTDAFCPKCQDTEQAEWTLQQTRGGDEPPTRFYRCKKCGWVWREYS